MTQEEAVAKAKYILLKAKRYISFSKAYGPMSIKSCSITTSLNLMHAFGVDIVDKGMLVKGESNLSIWVTYWLMLSCNWLVLLSLTNVVPVQFGNSLSHIKLISAI